MNMKSLSRKGWRQRGVALVIVLTFVVLLTVVVVAYFSRVMNSRQLANDSFNGGKTDQLARSAMDVIVNDFKQEIANGSTATTVNGVTTYYPAKADGTLVRANMVPMRSGTNDAIPNLIRRSVQSDPMASPGVASRASKVNSASNASINGRVVSLARWNKHYLIPQADPTGSKSDPVTTFTAPDWVMMTKEEGPAVLTAPTQDAAGNTVTPVGRYAYAVYDEGGLLDANVAGFPTGTTLAQLGTKGLLASADLTQVPIKIGASQHPNDYLPQQSVIDQLIGWRNYASAQPGGSFGGFSFDIGSATRYYNAEAANTSGFLKASTNFYQNRTDQAFLSRGQLLTFQQSLQQNSPGAFPSSALQYLGTFSRELNAPSWGPTQNAADIDPHGSNYAYKDIRSATYSYNRLLTEVRYANAGTITSYRADGTPYTYAVKKGDPLVQRRFPLGRLAWLGPNGPNTAQGGTDKNISDCFGLKWNGTSWLYTVTPDINDPALTTDPNASIIRKLGSVANEVTPREPNFFELLQEGMLYGSLGLSPEMPLNSTGDSYLTKYEAWVDLNVFRIGASIITQAQQLSSTTTKYYPTVVQYTRSGTTFSAVGIDDLPYLSMFHMLAGKNPATTDLACYLMFGLWNPHQIIAGTSARPLVRLRVMGNITLENKYGAYPPASPPPYGVWNSPGYTINLNAQINLASGAGVGVNGFTDPHALMPADLQPVATTLGDSTGLVWASLPAMRDGTVYAGYRLHDFLIDTSKKPPTPADTTPTDFFLWSFLDLWANTNILSPFNCWLEYQAADGVTWIPYTYHAGIENGGVTGLSKQPQFYAEYLGQSYPNNTKNGDMVPGNPPNPLAIDPPAGYSIFYYTKYPWANTDPCTLRFNYSQEQTPQIPTDNLKYLYTSIWGPLTEAYTVPNTTIAAVGRQSTQNIPTLFYPPPTTPATLSLSPAGFARNNNTVALPPNSSSPGAYYDNDGVRRVADSGLFVDMPASTNSWAGDPYALADVENRYPSQPHRVSDRPVILHRPFANVAELGYVSRDYPWRTLDFFTSKSADAGLMDIFTTSPSTESISAGRINLNSRNVTALNAVLSQSVTDILPTPLSVLTKPQAIATKLAALTSSTTGTDGPFIGKDEIVTRFVGTKLSSGALGSDFTTTDEQNIKARREAVTRALAEVGQTRTWNLLVDVVAQSGRYPVNASQLGQFNVEGERHYWMHVAIDRFTGEVIDQQLEAVTE